MNSVKFAKETKIKTITEGDIFVFNSEMPFDTDNPDNKYIPDYNFTFGKDIITILIQLPVSAQIKGDIYYNFVDLTNGKFLYKSNFNTLDLLELVRVDFIRHLGSKNIMIG